MFNKMIRKGIKGFNLHKIEREREELLPFLLFIIINLKTDFFLSFSINTYVDVYLIVPPSRESTEFYCLSFPVI